MPSSHGRAEPSARPRSDGRGARRRRRFRREVDRDVVPSHARERGRVDGADMALVQDAKRLRVAPAAEKLRVVSESRAIPINVAVSKSATASTWSCACAKLSALPTGAEMHAVPGTRSSDGVDARDGRSTAAGRSASSTRTTAGSPRDEHLRQRRDLAGDRVQIHAVRRARQTAPRDRTADCSGPGRDDGGHSAVDADHVDPADRPRFLTAMVELIAQAERRSGSRSGSARRDGEAERQERQHDGGRTDDFGGNGGGPAGSHGANLASTDTISTRPSRQIGSSGWGEAPAAGWSFPRVLAAQIRSRVAGQTHALLRWEHP